MITLKGDWCGTNEIASCKFTCGHCNENVSSNIGYFNRDTSCIYICHSCNRPVFIEVREKRQVPSPKFGNNVDGIDDDLIGELYEEARSAFSANAYTAVILCCRKILMHIAVSKGADKGNNFVFYVNYLKENNYIPPGSEGWVDHIRTKGNEANHEIIILGRADAKDLISFIEMLLKLIFEFPMRLKRDE